MGKRDDWWPEELSELPDDLTEHRNLLIKKAEADAIKNYYLEEKKEGQLKALNRKAAEANNEKETTEIFEQGKKEIQKWWDNILFGVRSEVVRAFYNSLSSAQKNTEKYYSKELMYGREWYPRTWMLNNKKIFAAMTKYPIVDVLNFIDKQSRYKKGESYKEMEALNRRVTNGRKYKHPDSKKKYEYASFLVTSEFLNRAAEEFDHTPRYFQKHIKAFCDCKIFEKLGRYGSRGGTLYADGFYVKTHVGLTKHRFLKNSKEFRNALAQFNPK